jgi:hypothetical protein
MITLLRALAGATPERKHPMTTTTTTACPAPSVPPLTEFNGRPVHPRSLLACAWGKFWQAEAALRAWEASDDPSAAALRELRELDATIARIADAPGKVRAATLAEPRRQELARVAEAGAATRDALDREYREASASYEAYRAGLETIALRRAELDRNEQRLREQIAAAEAVAAQARAVVDRDEAYILGGE